MFHVCLSLFRLSVHAPAGHRSVSNDKQKCKFNTNLSRVKCVFAYADGFQEALIHSLSFSLMLRLGFQTLPHTESPPSRLCVCGSVASSNPHCVRRLLGSFRCSLLSSVCESVFLNLSLQRLDLWIPFWLSPVCPYLQVLRPKQAFVSFFARDQNLLNSTVMEQQVI